MHEILKVWDNRMSVETDTASSLNKRLQQGRQYLRSDFKANLALHSPVLSHCLQFALSDPTETVFQKPCSPEEVHLTLCDRCESLNNVLEEMKTIGDRLFAETEKTEGNMILVEERERHAYEIGEAIIDVEQLQTHLVRARFTELERNKIIEELPVTTAFLTLDWAQKLLSMKFWETQRDYFVSFSTKMKIVLKYL